MIKDRLENAQQHCNLHPDFERAFSFLLRSDLAQLPADRYDIDGERLFCFISTDQARSRSEAKLEAHRRYIDIQYLIAGREEMGWRLSTDCSQVQIPYDAPKDIVFYDDQPETWTELSPGEFILFFPKDAHAPLVGDGLIHKAVLKIAVK